MTRRKGEDLTRWGDARIRAKSALHADDDARSSVRIREMFIDVEEDEDDEEEDFDDLLPTPDVPAAAAIADFFSFSAGLTSWWMIVRAVSMILEPS